MSYYFAAITNTGYFDHECGSQLQRVRHPPWPTPGSLPSTLVSQNPLAASVSASFAGSTIPLPGTPDTPACSSPASLSLPASTATAGIPTSALPALLPPISSAAVRRSCGSHSSSCGAQGAAGNRNAASRGANSRGGKYPKTAVRPFVVVLLFPRSNLCPRFPHPVQPVVNDPQ